MKCQAGILAVIALCVIPITQPAAAQTQPNDDAKRHFQRGLELVDASRFEDASVEFEQAYAISPRAAVLYNIALAHAAARRPALALDALLLYLEKGAEQLDAARIDEVQAEIASLRSQVATLRVISQPVDARIRVDGRLVRASQTVVVDPGTHAVVASAPGFSEIARNIVARSGEGLELNLALEPLPNAVPSVAPVTSSTEGNLARDNRPTSWPTKAGSATSRPQGSDRTWRYWAAGSTAIVGVLLAGTAVGLAVDNGSRHSRWELEQNSLDTLWRSTKPADALIQRQAANDTLAERIQLQDKITVGVGVASGAALVVAAVVWFVHADGKGAAARTAWTPRYSASEVSFPW